MLKMKNLVTLPKTSLLKLANKELPQVKLSKSNLTSMLGARSLHSGSYKGATIANMLGARSLHSASYKGTTTLFKPEYSFLSPLTGIGLQETGWLQKNWELIPNSATAQLIASPENGLFYKLQSQFRPTQNKSLPGYSLTPKLLGQLIGYMETGAIFDLESPVMKEFIAAWRTEHKKLTGSKLMPKNIMSFLTLVQKALQETNKDFGERLYLPYTPHKILWAFLYRKFDTKQELAQALSALNEIASCLTDPSILSSTEFLESRYSDEEAQAFVREVEALPEARGAAYILREAEQSLHAIILKKTTKPLLPPQVIQGSYSYKDFPTVPDCVETASLEALVNMLLYNPQTGAYDKGLVGDKTAPRKEFIDFLAQITPATINSEQVRTAWMNLVSGHDFMKYNREQQYEMLPKPANILALANYLYGLEAQNVTELADLLSSPSQKVSMKLKEDQNNSTQIIIELSGIKNTDFRMNLYSRHGFVERKYQAAASSVKGYLQNVATIKSTHPLTLFRDPLTSDSYDSSYFLAHKLSNASLKNMDDPNDRLSIFRNLAATCSQKPAVIDVLKRLIRSMPDDNYFKTEIFKACVEHDCLELFPSTYTDNPKDRLDIFEYLVTCCSRDTARINALKRLIRLKPDDYYFKKQSFRMCINHWGQFAKHIPSMYTDDPKACLSIFIDIASTRLQDPVVINALMILIRSMPDDNYFKKEIFKACLEYGYLELLFSTHKDSFRELEKSTDRNEMYKTIRAAMTGSHSKDLSKLENEAFDIFALTFMIDNDFLQTIKVIAQAENFSFSEEPCAVLRSALDKWWNENPSKASARLEKIGDITLNDTDKRDSQMKEEKWIHECLAFAADHGLDDFVKRYKNTKIQNAFSKQATPSAQLSGFMQWIARFFKR
jgi:hypothetical protein